VLDKPNYRARAALMAEEFAEIDTRSEILQIVSKVLASFGWRWFAATLDNRQTGAGAGCRFLQLRSREYYPQQTIE
jgi:hypothetical protein